MSIGIDEYNANERKARAQLDNESIRAFLPSFFNAMNYPATVQDEGELVRYVDVMHEYDLVKRYFDDSYSRDEVALLERVGDNISGLTEKLYHRKIRPWVGPLSAVPIFRGVTALAAASGKKSLSVLEIGPGSGYLGALLYAAGHDYLATDNAQAFYLWQNRLFEHLAGDDFTEFALEDSPTWQSRKRLAHLPWWQFAKLRADTSLRVDVIVCDRALAEMSTTAVCYVGNLVRVITKGSPVGALLFEQVGSTEVHSEAQVEAWLGFGQLVKRLSDPLQLYSPEGSQWSIFDALRRGLPKYNPSQRGGYHRGPDFIRFRPEEAPLGYETLQFMGFREIAKPFDPGHGVGLMETSPTTSPAVTETAPAFLSIKEYDENEELAKIALSFSEIMAYSPRTFDYYGFPARIKVELELARYADWSRDAGNQQYFFPGQFLPGPCVQTDFSYDEAELINRVCDQTVEMTSTQIGRPVRPVTNMLAHVGLFRIVSALEDIYERKFRILEIGPGTGYLGAYLINTGHSYASMDNAQAFYLWQNRLFTHVARGEFVDWASSGNSRDEIKRVTHVPWWRFLQLSDVCPFDVDIVISNTNLSEMQFDAMKFLVRTSARLLQKSDLGLFLFSDLGASRESNLTQIEAEFGGAGFRRVFQKKFSGFMVKGKLPRARTAFLEKNVPLYNPSRKQKLLAAGDFLYLPPDQRPLDLRFTHALEGWSPPVPTTPQGDYWLAAANGKARSTR